MLTMSVTSSKRLLAFSELNHLTPLNPPLHNFLESFQNFECEKVYTNFSFPLLNPGNTLRVFCQNFDIELELKSKYTANCLTTGFKILSLFMTLAALLQLVEKI